VLVLLVLVLILPSSSLAPQLYAQTSGKGSTTPGQVVTTTPGDVTTRSGRWSEPTLWSKGRLPLRGESVVIALGHIVTYDVFSDVEIGRVLIQGTLAFARDRVTRLDTGNVIVGLGGYLEMGTAASPIPATVVAEIRFVISASATCTGGPGFVEGDTGLWVMTGGRWEAHGAPVRVTWSKLSETASVGTSLVRVVDNASDWQPGSWVVVTPTDMGTRSPATALTYPQYEERQIVSATWKTTYTEILLSSALAYKHEVVGNAAGEVALLSRSVVITSKYPTDKVNAHTMFMAGSTGGIGYAEFRDMGALGCLGRYPVHFHMMSDGSRGMVVKGASIWRSNNNFMNIHVSSGITVEDTVGYHTTGVGYYIGEPAAGMHSADNLFLNNMAARVVYRTGGLAIGKFRGSGFWIQSMNSTLIGNVASGSWTSGDNDSGFHIAEADEFTDGFSPLLMVRNEAHTNNGSGMFTWHNGLPVFPVIDFRAWRNGFAGIDWGAYHNFMAVYRAILFENGTYNFNTSATDITLVDSQLYATAAYPTATGVFIGEYFVFNDPTNPSLFVRDTFTAHAVHVSQDHTPCANTIEESNPLSQVCSATYLLFWQSQFTGGKAFDFGWHRNANSYFKVRQWSGTASPPIAATHFRLLRRDRPRPDTDAYYYAPYDAWLDPLATLGGAGVPPLAILVGLTDGAPLGATVTFTVTSPSAISKVTYYVDERVVATQTSGPFTFVWSSSGWTRRYAHVFAAVTGTGGNTGYTQVIRLRK